MLQNAVVSRLYQLDRALVCHARLSAGYFPIVSRHDNHMIFIHFTLSDNFKTTHTSLFDPIYICLSLAALDLCNASNLNENCTAKKH